MDTIFISHSSQDKKLVQALARLIEGAIHLQDKHIFCTSVEDLSIPLGKDPFPTILHRLQKATLFIAVISENYYTSAMCMTELGAAWGLNKPLIALLAPPLDYNDLQGILASRQSLLIRDSDKLAILLGKIYKIFRKRKIDRNSWRRKIDNFLLEISGWHGETEAPFFRGFLDQYSILFHDVHAKVAEIIREMKVIPTKFLFAHADSYKYYTKLIADHSYTMGHKAHDFFRQQCPEISRDLFNAAKAAGKLNIVSLGVGTGIKENYLLQQLCHQDIRNIRISFLAVDINPAFLQSSLNSLRSAVCEHNPNCSWNWQFLIADFDHIECLVRAVPKGGPIVFLALGGIIGNQDEAALLTKLREHSHDIYLLVDYQTVESFDGPGRGGYDSDANKKFIKNIVNDVCQESVEPENIKACFADELNEIKQSSLSSVQGSRTIVMVATVSNKQRRYVGYSTGYEEKALKEFIRKRGYEVCSEYSDEANHYRLCLLKTHK